MELVVWHCHHRYDMVDVIPCVMLQGGHYSVEKRGGCGCSVRKVIVLLLITFIYVCLITCLCLCYLLLEREGHVCCCHGNGESGSVVFFEKEVRGTWMVCMTWRKNNKEL